MSTRPEAFAQATADRVDERAIGMSMEERLEVVDIDRSYNFEEMRVVANSASGDRIREYGFRNRRKRRSRLSSGDGRHADDGAIAPEEPARPTRAIGRRRGSPFIRH